MAFIYKTLFRAAGHRFIIIQNKANSREAFIIARKGNTEEEFTIGKVDNKTGVVTLEAHQFKAAVIERLKTALLCNE